MLSTLQSPLERYRLLQQAGELQPDPSQARAALALDRLYRSLKSYRPGQRRFFGLGTRRNDAPKGIYLHGDVGRGKSLLMDLFFDSVAKAKKRRVHFNAFMTETHACIHEWRNLSDGEKTRRAEFVREAGDDPLAPIAKHIFSEATLLCFDEFQVTDVADAMILGRLFEKLFALGAVVVLTSNIAPARLYEGGLNRTLFLPFIAQLKEKLHVLALDGPRDFRLERMSGLDMYLTPLDANTDARMDEAWHKLTDSKNGEPLTLNVLERKLVVPRAAKGVARFSFDALCGKALGMADYLALARTFHTLLIDRIPKLTPEQANEARRFTLLIDTLYDEKTKLVCSAAALPSELYVQGDHADAFRRAASRLIEMQSADYLRLGHSTHQVTTAK
jgi:cell division protein ZapE